MHHGKLPVFTNVSNIQIGRHASHFPTHIREIMKWQKVEKNQFKYHHTGQELWPMNPSPSSFLTCLVGEPWIMCIFTSSSSISPYLRVLQEERATDTFTRTQNDQSFSKQWFIHKRFQEDQLRSSQNYNRCGAIPILSQHSFLQYHKQN